MFLVFRFYSNHKFMPRHFKSIFENREQAGKLLSRKLSHYKLSDAIVIGIPAGGLMVAAPVAKELQLHLDALSCRKIRHPSVTSRYIGSVSADEMFVDESDHDLPQDYIYHQLIMLRSAISYEQQFYDARPNPGHVENRTVILVDDYLQHSGCVKACLQSVRNAHPSRIVFATPVISDPANADLLHEVDAVVSVFQESALPPINMCYEEEVNLLDSDMKQILDRINRMETA